MARAGSLPDSANLCCTNGDKKDVSELLGLDYQIVPSIPRQDVDVARDTKRVHLVVITWHSSVLPNHSCHRTMIAMVVLRRKAETCNSSVVELLSDFVIHNEVSDGEDFALDPNLFGLGDTSVYDDAAVSNNDRLSRIILFVDGSGPRLMTADEEVFKIYIPVYI